MWSGSPGPFIRPKAKGSMPARNLARRAGRRHVLPGFPVDPWKMSLSEIRDYFATDRLLCLRCGKSYKTLGVHLRAIHSMTDDDYKEAYGLPWSRGLAGFGTRNLHQEATRAMIDHDVLCERLIGAREKRTGKQRSRQPFRNEVSVLNLKGGA